MFKLMRKVIDILLIVFASLFALWAVANLFLPHPPGLKWLADELTYVAVVIAITLVFRKVRNTFSDNPTATQPYRLSRFKFTLLALAMTAAWIISYVGERAAHPGVAGVWTGMDTYYTILLGVAMCTLAFTTFRNRERK